MSERAPLHLFEGYGIELEYMIVDRDSLAVKPVTDRVLQQVSGEIVNEIERGPLCWSNELVLHVIELKTNGPAPGLKGLAAQFQSGIAQVNEQLAGLNARLLGTAMHPWMEPHRETVLWPHENSPIYDAYNRIFGCQGHGWSNLQSMHINLPFSGDAEFGRLHAAIRLVLPLLPALAASSPIVSGEATGLLDNRLEFYRNNQKMIPEIAGQVIPEAVFTRADYEDQILAATYRAIAPHDPQNVLQEEWLNSRGAIARFERSAIEIRLLDIQECPMADLAIAALTIALIRALCKECWIGLHHQQEIAVAPLAELFKRTLQGGGDDLIDVPDYLSCFGVLEERISVADLWRRIYEQLESDIPMEYRAALEVILHTGPLAGRILQALPQGFSQAELAAVYRQLADCLHQGVMFHG
ncbi:carboxylate-amine ligase [Geopsychrobacter electrodiphilus]|uniref:carboxylate-amine ligase n=1 Tax=Geopsychrobacter electrodiphilus TaxID=225196 RepID=UPI00037D3C62|nr:glutamate-cysteine ligase family protein [Geopsychrobacter electrodiphilus]